MRNRPAQLTLESAGAERAMRELAPRPDGSHGVRAQLAVRQAFPPLDAAQRRLNLCRYFDPVAILAAAAGAYAIAHHGSAAGGLEALAPADALALGVLPWIALVALRVAGLYDAERYLRGEHRLESLTGRLAIATLVATLVAIGLDVVARGMAITSGGGMVLPGLVVWGVALASTLAVRAIVFSLTSPWSQPGGHQVLLVGTGPRAMRLFRERYGGATDRVRLLGLLIPRTASGDESSAAALGTLTDLEKILLRQGVDEVLVALPLRFCYADIQETFDVCARVGVPATYIDDVFATPVDGSSGCEIVAGSPLLRLRVTPEDRRLLIKRAIDLTGAALGVILLSPLLLLTALAIKLTGRGPVIFRQQRYGLNRRLFTIYKFRTMVCDAEQQQDALEAHNEADGPVFKIREDPRMTAVGRVLRRTSIDELPQLFNVIVGNMSLCGPRPLPMRDVERFSESWLMRRFSVLPGITGPWQVSGRSDLSFNDWVRLDLDYIDRWSLGRDLRLICLTIPAVLRGHGAA
jgi:exopolysaccharide biosynthesis polyprenyl glycosylphosphotransferase